MLCLYVKYEILNYPDQEELSNKRSELVSKCRHVNKFLLANYKSNDQCINQLIKKLLTISYCYNIKAEDCKSYFT